MIEEKTTTMQVAISLNERVKKLAELRSSKMGLSKNLSRNVYLEILVTEEEKRSGI